MDQDEQQAGTLAAVQAFFASVNRKDMQGILDRTDAGICFENTYPPPDGSVYQGREAFQQFWEEFFTNAPNAWFDIEEIFASDDRCIVRWKYTWDEQANQQGYVRGVDLYRVSDGKILEKLSYVKG